MLRRVDAAQLRHGAGIRRGTVAAALGVSYWRVYQLEQDGKIPQRGAGLRWARVIAGLERHAAVTAELAAMEQRAA